MGLTSAIEHLDSCASALLSASAVDKGGARILRLEVLDIQNRVSALRVELLDLKPSIEQLRSSPTRGK
jgi:hypothetical protein